MHLSYTKSAVPRRATRCSEAQKYLLQLLLQHQSNFITVHLLSFFHLLNSYYTTFLFAYTASHPAVLGGVFNFIVDDLISRFKKLSIFLVTRALGVAFSAVSASYECKSQHCTCNYSYKEIHGRFIYSHVSPLSPPRYASEVLLVALLLSRPSPAPALS